MKKAFTLIELLIVVAIIAILAAIAVPNFLEAQVRAKVSRTRADMRTVATALEAYAVDNNKYTPMSDFGVDRAGSTAFLDISVNDNNPDHARVSSFLTTPISYITSIPEDVFVKTENLLGVGTNQRAVGKRFVYFNLDQFLVFFPTSTTFATRKENNGSWFTYAVGPDKDPFNRIGGGAVPPESVYLNYDSSNGTISIGNIFRTQNNPEGYKD